MVKAFVNMERSFVTTFVMPHRFMWTFVLARAVRKNLYLNKLGLYFNRTAKLILVVQNKHVSTKQVRLFTEHLYLVISDQALVSLAKFFMKLVQNVLEGL